jgi:hypothetical protein
MVDLPPGEVGKMFRNSLWRFSADLEVSKWVNKYAADSQEGTQLLDKGPWWEPQQKYMRSTKPSRLDKVLVAAYNAGGVVTALKLNQWGYDIDPNCSCGQLDTQYHRAWTCTRPDVLKARNDAGNKRILRLAANTPGSSPLFARLFIGVPEVTQTEKPDGVELQYMVNGQEVEPFSFRSEDGVIYPDGSCIHGQWELLARAAWCLAQKLPEGDWATISGNIHPEFRQTAACAEHSAAYWSCVVVDEPCIIKPDCSGVVQCHKRGRQFSVSGNRPMAGI